MKYAPDKPFIHGLSLQDLERWMGAQGQPAFRAKQLADWLFHKYVRGWDDMRNVPKALRATLDESFELAPCRCVDRVRSSDTTDKLLLELGDGSLIETVIIRAPQEGVGQAQSRYTVCISTQVGCAYGCKFCASGLEGWKRNLHAGEIVGQLLHVIWNEAGHDVDKRAEGVPFDNIVVMGMGEPLANYDNLMQALTIVNADWGMNVGARRITVSTSGVVPKIYRLAEEPIQFRLAISLHGATDEVREKIMPINRKWPLAELLLAAQAFNETHGRMLTLEYILIEDVNDQIEQAKALAQIARDLHAHVNCIPYNTVEGLSWKRPNLRRQNTFVGILEDEGVSVTIRREKGHEIDAACGQLRLRKERELEQGT